MPELLKFEVFAKVFSASASTMSFTSNPASISFRERPLPSCTRGQQQGKLKLQSRLLLDSNKLLVPLDQVLSEAAGQLGTDIETANELRSKLPGGLQPARHEGWSSAEDS